MDKIINNLYNVLNRERNEASDEQYKKFYFKITDAILTLMVNDIIDSPNDDIIQTLKEFHPDNKN